MSMITRCPECSTLFRVVPDQLRISEGWVRCGQCGQVFDGAAHLQKVAGAEVVTQPRSANVEIGLDPEGPQDSAARHSRPGPGEEEGLGGQQFRHEPPIAATKAGAGTDDAGAAKAESPVPNQAEAAAPREDAPTIVNDRLVVPADEDVSFLRAARRRLFWSRPTVRWGLALAGVALTLVLVLQVAVHERDRLASQVPQTKPWLLMLCEGLGCSVQPPKSIETLTVESSSFNRVRGDAYRLQVTLKNTARTELQWPAVELTLTDTRDLAVLRRVLLPADLGVNTPSMPAAAEWTGTAMVSLSGVARVSGYRVLAFYP